jgi:hypothetical protein
MARHALSCYKKLRVAAYRFAPEPFLDGSPLWSAPMKGTRAAKTLSALSWDRH